MVDEGAKIENFSLHDQNDKTVSLSDFDGKKKVVYFYPKDDTPGCTKEACSFRDEYAEIRNMGAVVIGISPDSTSSHAKFAGKYELPFVLLADPDKEVIQRFGAWGEKKMYGKTYEGVIRSTFVLDENNVVVKAFPKVKPDGHARQIIEVL